MGKNNLKGGRGIFFTLTLLMLVLVLAIPVDSSAQTKGTIVGRVTDTEADSYLPGANVFLEGTLLGGATDRAGEYTIQGVKPGTYTLKVNYIGYEEYSAEVTMPEGGGVVGHDIGLKVAYLQADDIVVYGIRQGQAKALNQQKMASNIKNVVAKEQMDRFPDLNTAEVLQRIPAVAIARDQGEGRYVLIRGTEARLNALSVNGERIASPENEERFVGMDVISANQIASIEVTKAVTPDMDADAIGGSVNLVTKSAFDFDRRTLNVTLGTGYGSLRGDPLWQGSFSYSDLLNSDNTIGITLSGNYYHSDRGSDNIEGEWGNGESLSGQELPWAMQDFQLRYYMVERIRYGLNGNIEFQPNTNNRFYIGAMYNRRDDTETRDALRYKINDDEYLDANSAGDSELERALKDRLEAQTMYNISAGGQNQFDGFKLDYTLAYSYGEEKKPEEVDPAFVSDDSLGLAWDVSDPDLPRFNTTGQSSDYEFNPANFKFDEVEYQNNISTHKDIMASVNFSIPMNLGTYPSELKFGGKYHMRTKERDDQVMVYGWEGADDVMMSAFTGETVDKYYRDEYRFGTRVDSDKSRDFFWANKDKADGLMGELNLIESLGADYKATEDILAPYAMLTVNMGNLMLLGGVRYEMTKYDLTGYDLELNDDSDEVLSYTEIKKEPSDNQFLPSIHLRYSFGQNTNIRAAFTSSLARPNYYSLVPYFIVSPDDEEVLLGNSDLKTTTATNFDLFGEHYFAGLGVLAGGVFYKSLKNIIYTQTIEESGGAYDGYDMVQSVNGEDAWLYGFEINWQQQLTFLPDFWNGFGVYANFTYTDSEAKLGTGRVEVLPGQAQSVANFALSYEKYGFTGRVSANYHGKFIEEIGEDKDYDRWYDEHWQWDFAASQRIYSGLRFYVEVINMTDAPLRYYSGITSRPVQTEYYSWWMHTGFKFEL